MIRSILYQTKSLSWNFQYYDSSQDDINKIEIPKNQLYTLSAGNNCIMFNTSNLSYKRQKLSTCVHPLGRFLVGSVQLIFLSFLCCLCCLFCFLLFCLSSACVLYVMCLVCHVSCMSCVLYVLCLVFPLLPVSLDCPFLIVPSVFFNIYLLSTFVLCLVYQMVHVFLDYPFVIAASVFSNVYLINIGNIPVVYNII